MWPRPGREIQPRISTLETAVFWGGGAFRRDHALVGGERYGQPGGCLRSRNTGRGTAGKDISLGTGTWTRRVFPTGSRFGSWRTRRFKRDAYVAATRARDASQGYRPWHGNLDWRVFRWHHALVHKKAATDDDIIAYLASDQSRQSADDITHADLAGSLNGGLYANGIAWIVEPDADTAIAFVDPDYVASKVYGGSTKFTKVYIGSTQKDMYKGSTRLI